MVELWDQHHQSGQRRSRQRAFDNDFHRLTCDLGIFFVIFNPFVFLRGAAYTTRSKGYSGLVESLEDGN